LQERTIHPELEKKVEQVKKEKIVKENKYEEEKMPK
jgi:hypothetical protein